MYTFLIYIKIKFHASFKCNCFKTTKTNDRGTQVVAAVEFLRLLIRGMSYVKTPHNYHKSYET